jgi:hypothetical protein
MERAGIEEAPTQANNRAIPGKTTQDKATQDKATQEKATQEKATASERRIAKRLTCDGFAEVVVPYSGFLFRGEISDLSEFGCYIKTRARLSIRRSADAELRFTVRGDNFSVLARTAVVKTGVGVGFEFAVIEPQMHKKLLNLIEELSIRENE